MSEANLLKALVLEDEWPTRNYLVKLIENTQRAEVVGAVANLDEAREAMAGSPVDIVFVDVQLAATGDSRTGLDLIRSMAGEPSAPMFVLATASSQHGLEAFELGVVDYILKPFTEERVEQCVKRVLERRGLSPDRWCAERPELIWCTITGFGLSSDRPGYDFVTQAECGWMSITGESEGKAAPCMRTSPRRCASSQRSFIARAKKLSWMQD